MSETRAIPGLVANAAARVEEMIEASQQEGAGMPTRRNPDKAVALMEDIVRVKPGSRLLEMDRRQLSNGNAGGDVYVVREGGGEEVGEGHAWFSRRT